MSHKLDRPKAVFFIVYNVFLVVEQNRSDIDVMKRIYSIMVIYGPSLLMSLLEKSQLRKKSRHKDKAMIHIWSE